MTDNTELVVGKLRVYRVWLAGGSQLFAMNGIPWETNMQARCTKYDMLATHVVPEDDCNCGIHARYFPSDLDDLLNPRFLLAPSSGTIAGAIEVSGKVVLKERGIRAERAKLLAICPNPTQPFFDQKALRSFHYIPRHYGVPLYPHILDLVNDFPPEDLASLGIEAVAPPFNYDIVRDRREREYHYQTARNVIAMDPASQIYSTSTNDYENSTKARMHLLALQYAQAGRISAEDVHKMLRNIGA